LMQPASSAIVISTATPGREGRTMGIYIGISMLSLAIGPVLGGVITDRFGWGWIFFINLPIAAMALVLAAIAKPPAIRSTERRIDLLGVILLVVSLPLFIGGVQQAGSWGLGQPLVLGMIFGGLLGLAMFLRRQIRVPNPVFHLHLLRDRGFLADALMLGLMQFALTGTVIQLSVMLQSTFRMDPEQAGIATLPLMIPVLLFVQVSGRLYDRFGVRPLAVPAALAAASAVVLLGVGAIYQSMGMLVAAMILLGTAIPFVNMPSNTDGMSRNEGVNRGQASGVLQTFRMVGSTLGIALTTSVIGMVSRRSPSEGAEVCPEIDPELLGRASRGNLKELAELVATAPEACVEFVREEIARGIGWGFIIAGLVASLATIVALWWTPAAATDSESRSSGS
ncbi:MAG: MFS transporter, partial [Phycisphaerales bacterium]|nr:MFS transporter [Phycisphaerales bacterium]